MSKEQLNKIVVNASALRSGGALTILKQFVKELPDDDTSYLLFVDDSVSLDCSQSNLQIVKVSVTSFVKRFLWDFYGLKRWLLKNKINCLVSVSLQNTNFRVSQQCKNYIYYHQSIPLYGNKWNLLKKEERYLWFYKYVYPFFVNLFINSDTEIFVQLEYIKDGFANRFNFNRHKIHVVFPNVEIPINQKKLNITLDKNVTNLFYPAAAYPYKNHCILFEALSIADKQLQNDVVLYLTVNENELDIAYRYRHVKIVFLGQVAKEEVNWLYHQVDALVFPSYIETFGLPLIEAASSGLPVIASDLPYAKEVLAGYSGAVFVEYEDSSAWGNEIINQCIIKGKRYENFRKESSNSWKYFFETINRNLYNV